MRPLSKLVGWAGNPKSHDIKAIQASLERFGFVSPVVLDDESGKIIAGHGRVSALRGMKAKKQDPPARVVVAGKDWLVPCLVGVAFADAKEAEAYLLADNRLVELGGWDADLTKTMLLGLTPELVKIAGFDALPLSGEGLTPSSFDLTEAPAEPEKKNRSKMDTNICPTCSGSGRV